MSQNKQERPGLVEVTRAVETLKRRRRARRRVAWILMVLVVLAGLLTTVARPLVLTRDCADPDLEKGSLVLVNRLVTATATDVTASFESSFSADTFYGTVSRAQDAGEDGVGTVWLQLYPYIALVK